MIAVSGEVRLLVPDPGHRLAGVRLVQELRFAGELLCFRRVDAGWQLDLARPPVSRMEYLLELRHADGSLEVVTDPANPLRARGAFGDKSVLEFPGYRPPAWLAAVVDEVELDFLADQREAGVEDPLAQHPVEDVERAP